MLRHTSGVASAGVVCNVQQKLAAAIAQCQPRAINTLGLHVRERGVDIAAFLALLVAQWFLPMCPSRLGLRMRLYWKQCPLYSTSQYIVTIM